MITTYNVDCEDILRRSIHVNFDFCSLITTCNGYPGLVPTSRFVSCTSQPNCFQLLPLKITQNLLDLNNQAHYMYVKQGSNKWHSIQKSVRVTGSAFLAALGLDTLSKQKQHHNSFVNNKEPPPFAVDVQEMLDHGKEFEKHGIATLVGAIMPALLPPCYMYFEVGSIILKTPSGRDIICVSPDGLLMCTFGNDC